MTESEKAEEIFLVLVEAGQLPQVFRTDLGPKLHDTALDLRFHLPVVQPDPALVIQLDSFLGTIQTIAEKPAGLLDAKDFIRMATFAWPAALVIIICMIVFYWVGLGIQPIMIGG